MKSVVTCLFLFLLVSSCTNKGKLTFDTLKIKENTCEDCPKIAIDIPKASENSKIAESINIALKEELISLLLFDDDLDVNDLNDAIKSFNNGYAEMKTLFSDESASWEANITGTVVFENNRLVTIALNSYIFTGGAHGYTSKRFLNFDKIKGVELENWELFSSLEKFEAFAETKFRKQESIPENESINHTGLMFEQDRFYLPENIGFTEEGLKLLYNPYEVASFADGPIELLLSHAEIDTYLRKKPKS